MRYAILSDIHANPWALERALADAREQGAEKYICLGDVVGYGPDAVGAVRLSRSAFNVVLMGNHDAATAGAISAWNFRPEARAGVMRHGMELSGRDLTWLRDLPYTHHVRAFCAAHGTWVNPRAFDYIYDTQTALQSLLALGVEDHLLFVGHTHQSVWVELMGRSIRFAETDELSLDFAGSYVVNVGSVGYPRCEDESVYVIYDSRRHQVTWRRLPFDYAGYLEKMRRKNIFIPPWLQRKAQDVNAKRR